ncbi:MAG: prolyl oligopeptidase family serine peptidase, partial [Gammaproteobacteria bacterium]
TYIAVEERSGGLSRLRIIERDGGASYYLPADEDVYVPDLDDNPDVSSTRLRYSFESLATPDSVYEIDMASRERVLLKQDPVLGYDPSGYTTQRLHATARDGTEVPVTLLYSNATKSDGTNPLYVLGYGSYGISYDPTFNEDRLSLVDRGFVFAIAHIRGGQEMGRQWYENGKLLNKKNTFTDFIDVTQYLVNEGWGDKDKVIGMGRSAGGLLAGAIANMAPDTFTAIVTEVPFVDVVTTMLDESIPLTTFEWDEWGNPAEKTYYDYMLSYSPYDQVIHQDYPHILVSTGLWDPAVQYWEPAKWVAKLRARKTDANRLLLFIDMDAGHGGQPGRFESLKETAREYAFIFDVLGID